MSDDKVTGSPDDKPAFLDQARAKATPYPGAAPDAVPTFDYELDPLPDIIPDTPLPLRGKGPSPGYQERHRMIARLHAFGYTNNQIANHLGYSASGICLTLQRPFVQDEVQKYRDAMVDPDMLGKLKAAGADAIAHIHRTILDPGAKEEIRSTNARWAVEKLTGKPKQEVSVESGTLSTFMELLKDMQSRNEILDVSPVQVQQPQLPGKEIVVEEPGNKWDNWLDSNLRG